MHSRLSSALVGFPTEGKCDYSQQFKAPNGHHPGHVSIQEVKISKEPLGTFSFKEQSGKEPVKKNIWSMFIAWKEAKEDHV